MRRTSSGKLVGVALFGASLNSWALEPAGAVTLELTSVPGCVTHAEFLAKVRVHVPGVREGRAGEVEHAFDVTFSSVPGGGFHGELRVSRRTDAVEGRRSIDGATCDDVANALALFTALSLAPDAARAPKEHGAEPATAGPLGSPPPAPVATAPAPPPSPATEPRFYELEATVGVQTGLLAAGLPEPLVLGGGFVSLGLNEHPLDGFAFRPAARLSFIVTNSVLASVVGGGADVRYLWGALDLCPLVGRWSNVTVTPCISGALGNLSVKGSVSGGRDSRALVRQIGAHARAGWLFARPFFLELGAGVEVPLARDTFYFEPNTVVYEVPPAIGLFTFGVGVRFP